MIGEISHIVFKISPSDYEIYLNRIKGLGLEIINPRSRIKGEGKSIHFYDYDNHLFELHTGLLEERLEMYRNNQKNYNINRRKNVYSCIL